MADLRAAVAEAAGVEEPPLEKLQRVTIGSIFMIVVLGGVGNIVGTVTASLGVGVTNQILEPWMGAVLGKIIVLAAIILFLQWRPNGIFVTKSRSLDS